jgi:hypothetical protein
MALLSLVESAYKVGWSIELLEKLTARGPKRGEDRKRLPSVMVRGERMIESDDLDAYVIYLAQPWPRASTGKGPHIPVAIKTDVKRECHLACAICGLQESGELAHIEAVATTDNNSPDNLLLLCPNHHTKFDGVHRLKRNVTLEDARAAKAWKRASRRRMLLHESNSRRAMSTLLARVEKLEQLLEAAPTPTMALAVGTELRFTLSQVSDTFARAEAAAAADEHYDAAANAPYLASTAFRAAASAAASGRRMNDSQVGTAVSELLSVGQAFRMPDETQCPHCDGRGQTGLVGDLCAYCQGSTVVSHAKETAYDPDDLDEVPCPHCDGPTCQARVRPVVQSKSAV